MVMALVEGELRLETFPIPPPHDVWSVITEQWPSSGLAWHSAPEGAQSYLSNEQSPQFSSGPSSSVSEQS